MQDASLYEGILRYIQQEESPIFASSEDYLYFRSLYQKPNPQPEKSFLNPISERALPLEPLLKLPKEPLPLPLKTDKGKENVVLVSPPAALETKKLPIPEKSIDEPSPPIKKEFETNWEKVLAKINPELKIFKQPPSDITAKKIAQRWKTKNQVAPLTILFYHEDASQKTLLNNIKIALETTFFATKLVSAEEIEKDSQWQTFLNSTELKGILICDFSLWQLPELMKLYKEGSSLQSRWLDEKPLFLFPDLSLYLKDTQLKRSLWKALCHFMQQFS
jgi:hypothetical protein